MPDDFDLAGGKAELLGNQLADLLKRFTVAGSVF